jgi:lipoyl(octanoyl) transferase
MGIQNKEVYFQNLGLIEYSQAWDYQEELLNSSVDIKKQNRTNPKIQAVPNYLLFCQHPHVYTLGKSGQMEHLLINNRELAERQATFFKINRGGDITYHGPGQLVGYPVLDLENFFTDIHKYMRFLEEAIILTCADYGIIGGRVPGQTGVWIEGSRKICAFGVRASRWITMHGFAFNINTDLEFFNYIVPCGIPDKAVTSVANELGYSVNFQEIETLVLKHLATLFGMKIIDFK